VLYQQDLRKSTAIRNERYTNWLTWIRRTQTADGVVNKQRRRRELEYCQHTHGHKRSAGSQVFAVTTGAGIFDISFAQ
jgi:hypothetical protein